MDVEAEEFMAAARQVQGEFQLRAPGIEAASVGSALRTASGEIYTGVSLHLACGIGFCAEHAAIAEMLKYRQVRIVSIVAVGIEGILPPCGRCRELMLQLSAHNEQTQVVVSSQRMVPLYALLPDHWLFR